MAAVGQMSSPSKTYLEAYMDMVERLSRVLAAIMWRQHLTEAQRSALGPIDGYADATWRTHTQAALDILATLSDPPLDTARAASTILEGSGYLSTPEEEIVATFDAVILAAIQAVRGGNGA